MQGDMTEVKILFLIEISVPKNAFSSIADILPVIELADDIKQFESKFETGRHDIAVIDEALINGYLHDLTEKISRQNSNTFTILISERKSPRAAAALFDAGINDYVIKRKGYEAELSALLRRTIKEIKPRATNFRRDADRKSDEDKNILDALIKSTSSAIFIYQDTKFVFVNSASEEITGYTSDELLKMNFWDVVHPDYQGLIKDRGLARQKGEDIPGRYEFKIIRKDGQIRWLDFTSTIISYDGMPAALGTAFDITEIKRMLSLLAESERRYHDLSDMLPSGIFELDKTGMVTYANRYLINLFGYSLEELDMGFSAFRIIAPLDRSRAQTNIIRIMNGLHASDNEYTGLKKDGTQFPILIYSSRIMRDGEIIGVRGIIIDNSEKKLAEQNFLLSSEKWKRTFDSISDLVAIIDPEGKIVEYNNAFGQYFGTKFDSINSRSCFEIIYRPVDAAAFNPLLNSIVSQKREESEINLDENYFLISVDPIYNSESEISGFVHVMKDITERKKIQSALSESEEKYRLISTVASDYMFSAYKNPDGVFAPTWVVGAFEHITGYTFEEYKQIGGWRATIFPDDLAQDDKDFEELRHNRPVISEIRIVKKDGTVEWVRTYAHPVWNRHKNELEGINGAVQNITERKSAEEFLKRSEERMRVIVEGTPHLFFYVQDSEANITYISPTVETITGYTVKEWLNQRHWHITDSEINTRAKEVTRLHLQGLQTEQPVNLEIKHADGYPILLEVYENPIFKDGKVAGLQGVAHNITERKRAEEDLKRSREAYKQFFDDDLTGDFISSADGRLLDCNPAYLKIMGFKSKEEALGCDLNTLFTTEFSRERMISDLLEKGRLEDYEYTLVRRDGKLIYIVSNIYANYDGKGNFISLKGYIFDNTTRKLAEIELSKLSEAVKQSPVMVMITDTNGRIEYVNPKFTAITQFTPEEVIGRTPRIINSGKNDASIYVELWHNINSGRDWSGELINKRKDGSLYWASVSISPLKNAEGKITHFISVTEDISDRKKLFEEIKESKERAEEASKAKTLFLAHMSHELRTPLVGILGYSDLLCTDLKTGDFFEMAKGIRRSGYRLLNTLNMILDLTRIETDKLEINFRTLNILEAVFSVYHTFKGAAAEKKLSLDLDVPDYPLESVLDEHLLVIVLENLINNAIKFTKEGSITIKAYRDDGSVFISIRDTGIGIDEKYFELIFEEFRQVSEGITRDHQGTGLGLTISKRYVEMMNGSITVNSSLGNGTEFTIRFPEL